MNFDMSSEVKDNGPKEENPMIGNYSSLESEDGSFLIGFIFPVQSSFIATSSCFIHHFILI